MNEDYPSALKLTNDKTSRASGKMGAIQSHDFGDGQKGNALDLGKRCDEMETAKPASIIPQRPAIKPRRITRKRISRFL